jgi:hypothetical protein
VSQEFGRLPSTLAQPRKGVASGGLEQRSKFGGRNNYVDGQKAGPWALHHAPLGKFAGTSETIFSTAGYLKV